jgi:LmbE family N-acetylglucosaminyl deacetylase
VDKKNVLIISPHPDDMEIGMGGTVTKLINQEFNVISFVVTDGRRSTSISHYSEDEMAEIRKREAQEAGRILGIEDLIFLGLHDVKSPGNQRGLKERLWEITDRFRPIELFTPHPKIDKHPTHRNVSSLVVETLDEMNKDKLLPPIRIWCYEVWTPFEKYDWIEDISGYINVKTAAVGAHRSQIEYKNYSQGIKGLNRYRAIFHDTSGITKMKYAEVFVELPLVSN